MNAEDVNRADDIHKLYRITDYVIMSKLGRGSYGRVYLAKNKQNQFLYAIKKLKSDQGVSTSTLREIGLLKILQHPNIVSFYQAFILERKIYMVLEYMKMSLDVFIRDHEISTNLLQSFMFQLLQATLFCHNRSILHRDIKSQNVLVHHNLTVVKLTDFGLARRVPISTLPLTPAVVTLYYRSPELLLGTGWYSSGIDIWSLGCVFAEMALKQAPFRVDGEMDLFHSWFTQLGVPADDDMPEVLLKFDLGKFSGEENPTITNCIKQLKDTVSPLCYDLIMKMFLYNPNKRINAQEALYHDFFKDFDKSVVPAINEERVGYTNIDDLHSNSQTVEPQPLLASDDARSISEDSDNKDE